MSEVDEKYMRDYYGEVEPVIHVHEGKAPVLEENEPKPVIHVHEGKVPDPKDKKPELMQPLYGVKEPNPKDKKPEPMQPLYGVKEPNPKDKKPEPIQPAYGVDMPSPIQPAYGVPGKQETGNLDISGATYGRSVKGAINLKADFSDSIELMVKALNGDKYAAMKKLITANWIGADADDFLSDIEKTRASLEKSLRSLKTLFNKAIDDDSAQFSKFQQKNVK